MRQAKVKYTDNQGRRRVAGKYTIKPEFCGYRSKRLVVRFGGQIIGTATKRRDALRIAQDHQNGGMR